MAKRRAPGPDKRSTSRFLARVLPGALPGPVPDFIAPSLPTARASPPTGDRWIHEIRFDGRRIQAHLIDGRPTLFDSSGMDATQRFTRIASALARLPVNAIVLDGEVIVQDARGGSDSAALEADLAAGRQDRYIYYAFDLLHLDGFTISAAPLTDRKRVLASLLAEAGPSPIAYSAHLDGDGRDVLGHVRKLGLTGIVSKVHDAPYQSGRTKTWTETKTAPPATKGVAPKPRKRISPAAKRVAAARPDARPLLVIDGDSFAHRAYHALPKTIRRKGNKGAGAIVGFANYLMRFFDTERPRAVVVAWDTLEVPNWRAEIFPPYQSGRVFDASLIEQLNALPKFVAACGFVNAKAAGFEADDFLAAAVAREEKRGGTVIVASGDRDAFQLASAATTIVHPLRAGQFARIGPAEVRERYGVEPVQVPDFIALRGDPSDKIPGARGIGAHGAASFLRRYVSLDAALADGRLAAQEDALRLYRRIATMEASAPLPRIVDRSPDWQAAAALARDWGLNDLADRLARRK